MRSKYLFVVLLTGVIFALSALPASAQGRTSGSIRGVVTDPDGLATPGVTVIAKSDALIGGRQVTVTSAQGVYRFPSLPPGVYEFEGALAGFQSILQQNVKIGLGQDIELNLQLGNLEMAEEIVVVANTVQVNTVSNASNFNMAEDFIERQPVSRDPTDLMNFAPGIENDQAYGAPSSSQNAYNVDGVDVSDPELGSQWVLPSMDWVQEVQVAGLGADAEYGGFTGAVVNLVTKSGGNQFHGDVRAYYSGGDLNSDNAPPGVEGTNKVSSDMDVSASFGGPVVHDKLWYFASGNYRDRAIEPFYSEGAPTDDRADNQRSWTRFLGKLTWQLNESNRVLFMVDSDDVVNDYRGVGDTVLASGAFRQDSPSLLFNASWESLITDSSFITAKVTGLSGGDDRQGYSGDLSNQYDSDSGFDWANYWQTTNKDVERTAFDASWSLFADGLLSRNDSHNFKFGFVYEALKSEYVTEVNGGVWYYDRSRYCGSLDEYFDNPSCGAFSSYRGDEWNLKGTMDGLHFYAQDAWKVGRFAANLGVRYSQYTGKFTDVAGTIYDENMWAPRAGLVWDLFGTGKTALKAHYGRYYDGMSITLYDREISGDALSDTEIWDYNTATGEYDDLWAVEVQARAEMDPNIEHPYVDQFVATFEQQLGTNVVLGLDYIHRENHNINAMVVSNLDDYDAYIAANNPDYGTDVPFFELVAPQENLITNPDAATRTYDSVALRLRKRYSSGWSLDGSLVWSDLTGTANYGENGYGTGFDDLNGFVNADGRLPNNSEWVFKFTGSVDLPWRILLSGFFQFRTGEYWTPYAVFEGLWYNDNSRIFITDRGSEQYDSRSVLDLRLQKEFGLGGDMAIAIFVDAFNVLDSDTVTAVNQRWGWYTYEWETHPQDSDWDPSSTFEDPLDIQTPREIRIGAKFSW